MRNRDYWTNRMIDSIVMGERSVLEFEDALLQAYETALVEVQKDIDAFYQRYASNHKISYAEARRRLNTVELKDFRTLLKKWYEIARDQGWSDVYIKYLEKLGKQKYISRLEMLEADIRYQIESVKAGQVRDMTDLLSINYLAAYYESYYTLAHGAEVAVRFNAVDSAGVERAVKTKWSQYTYSQSVWNDRDKLVRTLQTVIPQSFSRGLNSNQLGDMIAKEMGTSRNRGRTLARTEVNHICNQATLDVYKAAGLLEYEYLATLDLRTSEICRSLDSSVFKVAEAKTGINYPPMHPNCRSTTVPYFRDEKDVEERLAKNAEGENIRVPRRMTQEEYINTYAPKDQRERLLRFRKKFYESEK